MIKRLLYIFTFLCIACAPKLKSAIIKTFPPLSDDALVVVLDISDDQSIKGEVVGDVQANHDGWKGTCTYYENIKNLKALSR